MGTAHYAPPPDPAPVAVPEPEPVAPEPEPVPEPETPEVEDDVPVARAAALIEESLNAGLAPTPSVAFKKV
jgi:hypothetical protein